MTTQKLLDSLIEQGKVNGFLALAIELVLERDDLETTLPHWAEQQIQHLFEDFADSDPEKIGQNTIWAGSLEEQYTFQQIALLTTGGDVLAILGRVQNEAKAKAAG
jgi:hypothetical protein